MDKEGRRVINMAIMGSKLNGILKAASCYLKTLALSPLVRNMSKVYSGDIVSKILAIGTLLLLIKGLSIDEYAAYTAFHTVLFLAPGLVGSGINRALVRFSAEYLSRVGKRPFELYFLSVAFQITLYIVSCIILFLIANEVNSLLFGQKGFGLALRYGLIGGLGVLLTQAGRTVYQAEERFGTYIKTLWFKEILTFIVIFFLFLWKQLNLQHAVQSMIGVNLVVGTIVISPIFREFSLRRLIAFFNEQLDIIKSFFSSSGWLIAYCFMLNAFRRLDVFMLSHFSTAEELANYGVAFRYYSMALLLLRSTHAVLLPKFSKIDMQDLTRQRQFTLKWLKATVWLIIPIAVGDMFGKPLFMRMNGIQYEKAFYVFVIFSFGVWFSLMFSPSVNVLMSRRDFKFLFTLAVGAAVLNFTGNYVIIPLWGGFGAALVTISSIGLINTSVFVKCIRIEHVGRGESLDPEKV